MAESLVIATPKLDPITMCILRHFQSRKKPKMKPPTWPAERRHACTYCPKSFTTTTYLRQHMRIHWGEKIFGPCMHCGRRFIQLSHLQQHLRTHTGEKPYKCPHPGCVKRFAQLSNLRNHTRLHESHKPYKCKGCYRSFATEEELLQHIPAHEKSKTLRVYICSHCGKSYTRFVYLTRHLRNNPTCCGQNIQDDTVSSTVGDLCPVIPESIETCGRSSIDSSLSTNLDGNGIASTKHDESLRNIHTDLLTQSANTTKKTALNFGQRPVCYTNEKINPRAFDKRKQSHPVRHFRLQDLSHQNTESARCQRISVIQKTPISNNIESVGYRHIPSESNELCVCLGWNSHLVLPLRHCINCSDHL